MDSRGARRVIYSEIISVTSARGRGTYIHTQDFYEFMYVISGSAVHYINETPMPIQAGDLVFVRPGDFHDIETTSENSVQFFNVELRGGAWLQFCEATDLDPESPGVTAPELGSMVHVPEEHRPDCLTAFQDCLHMSPRAPALLEVHRFLCSVLWRLREMEKRSDTGASLHIQPVWLTNACNAMRDWQNLSEGLDRFVELSGVTVQHLSRVLKASTGQTPTEFINALRLNRAARLLSATDFTISDIALDCGFQNLPYFYRIFQQQYGSTPRSFRLLRSQIVEAETIDLEYTKVQSKKIASSEPIRRHTHAKNRP